MLTYTVGEIVDGDRDLAFYRSGHFIYLYRRGQEVLYIGQSSRPSMRLRDHIMGDRDHQIGQEIKRNLPGSREWQVDLFTAADCKELAQEYCCILPSLYPTDPVDIAERALIYHHQPLFNVAHKALPSSERRLAAARKLILAALSDENTDYPTVLRHIAKELGIQLFPPDK